MHYIRKTILAAGVAAALPGTVSAAGFGIAELSTSALGSAFAGVGALSENASNQWYNPAVLASLRGTHISLATNQLMVDTSFDNDGAARPGDMEDINATVPSFYYSTQLNGRTSFGLAVNAPFGTLLEYENNWGGDNFATESDLQTLNVNPSFAFEVTSTLRLGVGVSYQKLEADLDSDTTRLEGEDKTLGWNAGALVEPVEGQRFGLSYRSRMDYKVTGDITFKTASTTLPAETNVTLPETWNLSYAGDVSEQSQILFSAQHREWSSLEKLVVRHSGPTPPFPNPVIEEFGWDDSQRYSLGLRHTLNSGTVLRAGYAHETTTQDQASGRSARVPDNDRDWFTIGATFKPVERMSIDVGYAHVMVDDADIDEARDFNGDGAITQGPETVKGTYELTANTIGAQLNYRF